MPENTPSQPQSFDRGKFKEMILYFSMRCEESKDAGIGMVKLNKLLYRADFEAYRTLGSSITGETYERQEFGPVARDLLIVLDELGKAEGCVGNRYRQGNTHAKCRERSITMRPSQTELFFRMRSWT